MSRDMLSRIPDLLDKPEKPKSQGELSLEVEIRDPKQWNQRIVGLCEIALKKIEKEVK